MTWPLGVRWPGGTAPALTKFGVDLVILTTSDGGSTWMGTANKDMRSKHDSEYDVGDGDKC